MSRTPIFVAVVVLLGLTLGAATAQTSDPEAEPAQPPSTELNVLFAHGTGDHEFLGFMNTLEEDGDDATMGSGQFINNAKTWTFHLGPNLTHGLVLDPEETIDAYAYMGGTNAGRLTVTTQISSGDDVLAKGEGKTLQMTGSYSLLTWKMKVLNDTIHPDTNLTWTIRASGIASGALLGVGGDRMSNITLPIVGGLLGTGTGIITTYTDVSTVSINESLEFGNATDARYQYNWTLEGDNGATGELLVDGTGNVSVTAIDGNGTEVINASATSGAANETAGNDTGTPGNGTQQGGTIPLEASNGTAGFWMVNVTVSNFTGVLRLSLGPVVEAFTPTEDPNGTATTSRAPRPSTMTTSAGTETADARGTPAGGPLLALAVLTLAALAARRRRG